MVKQSAQDRQRLAQSLGLSVDELRSIRQQLAVAERGLQGRTKSEKRSIIAKRLSMTVAELKTLRDGLGGASSAAARMLAAQVLGLTEVRRPIASAPAVPTPKASAVRPRGVISPAPRVFSHWNADTNVYVTPWGDVVHMYSDCHGARGFRHPDEPDPVITQVRLRDPICTDRRACRKCFDVWSPATIDRLDDLMESIHGKRRPPQRSTARKPSGTRVIQSTPSPRVQKSAKEERDRREAAKLNITIVELRARRRAEHEANRARRLQRQ